MKRRNKLRRRYGRAKKLRVKHDLWLCDDCLFVEVNGDTSGIDSPEHVKRVEDGLVKLHKDFGHISPNYDSETEEGIYNFSRMTCDGCGSHLAGGRHRFAVLG